MSLSAVLDLNCHTRQRGAPVESCLTRIQHSAAMSVILRDQTNALCEEAKQEI